MTAKPPTVFPAHRYLAFMAIESAAALPWITAVDWGMVGRSLQRDRCRPLVASSPLVASLCSITTAAESTTVPVAL